MTALTKPNEIEMYRLLAMRAGLRIEVNTGMSHSSGTSMYTRIKKEFGFKGNKKRVLEQFNEHIFKKQQLELPIDETDKGVL